MHFKFDITALLAVLVGLFALKKLSRLWGPDSLGTAEEWADLRSRAARAEHEARRLTHKLDTLTQAHATRLAQEVALAAQLTAAQEALKEASAREDALQEALTTLTQDNAALQELLTEVASDTVSATPVEPAPRKVVDKAPAAKSLTQLLEEALPAWKDKLIVLPSALKAAKKSVYAEPADVIGALDLLATMYPAMRAGEVSRESWSETLMNRLMEDRNTMGARWEGSSVNDPLYVQYKGRRTLMDRHLCKGNNTDPRRCMRLYFFWDEETKKAVVGHLPDHLRGRTTERLGL